MVYPADILPSMLDDPDWPNGRRMVLVEKKLDTE
jgi:hypothetical protein